MSRTEQVCSVIMYVFLLAVACFAFHGLLETKQETKERNASLAAAHEKYLKNNDYQLKVLDVTFNPETYTHRYIVEGKDGVRKLVIRTYYIDTYPLAGETWEVKYSGNLDWPVTFVKRVR